MNLEFRLAVKNDLNIIYSMFRNAIDKMNESSIFQWDNIYPNKETLQNDIEKSQMYIGFINDKIVSAFVLNKECDKEYENGKWQYNNEYLVVHRLCVLSEFQNCGVGTLTMKHIEKIAKTWGVEAIRLDCFTKNPYAVRMYQKLGYNTVGFADWRKGKFYLMEKSIKNLDKITVH